MIPDVPRTWTELSEQVPDQIDEYEVDRIVARGAHGTVFKATDPHGLKVAIKWLKKRRDDSELETFIRLSKTVKGMPPILGSGTLEDRTYFVTPYYERRSLRFRLRSMTFPQPDPEVIRLANAFTNVLGELHRHGYTHFDFKPDNLLLEALPAASDQTEFSLLRNDERLILTDFGTTRSVEGEDQFGDGTPGYAAPELLTTIIDHDPRVDVYAASATLVECITGVAPVQVRTATGHAFTADVLAQTGPWESVLRKGLNVDPRHRPQTITEWFGALCEKADVVEAFSSEPVEQDAVPITAPRTGGTKAVRRGTQVPRSGFDEPTDRRAAKKVVAVVAAMAVVMFGFWLLTQTTAEPSLSSAVDDPTVTGQDDDTASEPASESVAEGMAETTADRPVSERFEAAPALPALEPDPVRGTPRRQLTSVFAPGDAPGGNDAARFHRVVSSSRAAMSPDEQWILTQREAQWTVVDRPSGDYQPVDLGRWSQPVWHPTEPATILHLAENELILLSTVVDGPTEVAADLQARITEELPEAVALQAPGHGEASQDGWSYAWAIVDADEQPIGFVTYDLRNDSVLGIKAGMPDGDIGDFESVAMTKTGDSVVLAFRGAYVISTVNFTEEWRIEQRPYVYELALSGSGQDVLVVANFSTGSFGVGWVVAHNLNDRSSSRLINLYDDANTNMQFSGLATDRPGWVLASSFNCQIEDAWTCNRLMALNVDDASIIDLAETNSCAVSAFAVPTAVVNRDFSLAWFNTDFGSCGEDAIVLELEINAVLE